MPSLTQSLERRIQELRSSIESQTADMAAYEAVLNAELSLSGANGQTQRDTRQQTSFKVQSPSNGKAAAPPRAGMPPAAQGEAPPEFRGTKTDLVMATVKARGRSGATPKEVDEAFAARRITKSKNLIYNALSDLVKKRKIERKDGRYFFLTGDSTQRAKRNKRKNSAEGVKKTNQVKSSGAKKTASKKGTRAASASKKSAQRATKRPAKKAAQAPAL